MSAGTHPPPVRIRIQTMKPWTRRLTMPLAFMLLSAGCLAGQSASPPPVAPTTAQPSPLASLPPDPQRSQPPAATSRTVAEIARLQALVAADPTDADAQRDLG